jgi:hypothetical protein
MIAFVRGDEERRRIKQKMAQPNRAPVESNELRGTCYSISQSASGSITTRQAGKDAKDLFRLCLDLGEKFF